MPLEAARLVGFHLCATLDLLSNLWPPCGFAWRGVAWEWACPSLINDKAIYHSYGSCPWVYVSSRNLAHHRQL